MSSAPNAAGAAIYTRPGQDARQQPARAKIASALLESSVAGRGTSILWRIRVRHPQLHKELGQLELAQSWWLAGWLNTCWLVDWLAGRRMTGWPTVRQSTGWSAGWLVGWLVSWLAGQPAGWLANCSAGWLVNRRVDWLTAQLAGWSTGGLVG